MASQTVSLHDKVFMRLQNFITDWNRKFPDKGDRLESNSQAIDYLLDHIEGK